MNNRDRVLTAAARLAERLPADKVTFAAVAEEAGMHWTAVRRHFGSKQAMRQFLSEKQVDQGQSLADTRTRILESAARVFAERGYAGASLELVAADAGMTKGAVYWHFSSKGDLFHALCERSLKEQISSLPDQVNALLASQAPVDVLTTLLLSRFECCEEGPSNPMLFFEFVASSREPIVKEKLRESFASIFGETGMMIKQMQDTGVVNPSVDSESLAIMLQGIINGLTLAWLIHPERVNLPALIPEVSRILWHGMSPEGRE